MANQKHKLQWYIRVSLPIDQLSLPYLNVFAYDRVYVFF